MNDGENGNGEKPPQTHTPGRGHRRKSDFVKQRRENRRKAIEQERNQAREEEKRRYWESLTEEQRKLLRGTDVDPDQ